MENVFDRCAGAASTNFFGDITLREGDSSFEFSGYQALLPTQDENVILSWRPQFDPIALLHRDSETDLVTFEPAPIVGDSVFDGECWGVDELNFAAHWHRPSQDWMRFHTREKSTYLSDTRIIGRTNEFAWDGFCNSTIQVRASSDHRAPWFWSNLRLATWIFHFTVDPERAFVDMCPPGRGTIQYETWPDGGWKRTWREDGTEISLRWWRLHDPPEQDVIRWLLIQKGRFNTPEGEHDASMVYHIVARKCSDSSRALPQTPGDIRSIHGDVQRIDQVHVQIEDPPVNPPVADNPSDQGKSDGLGLAPAGPAFWMTIGGMACAVLVCGSIFNRRKLCASSVGNR